MVCAYNAIYIFSYIQYYATCFSFCILLLLANLHEMAVFDAWLRMQELQETPQRPAPKKKSKPKRSAVKAWLQNHERHGGSGRVHSHSSLLRYTWDVCTYHGSGAQLFLRFWNCAFFWVGVGPQEVGWGGWQSPVWNFQAEIQPYRWHIMPNNRGPVLSSIWSNKSNACVSRKWHQSVVTWENHENMTWKWWKGDTQRSQALAERFCWSLRAVPRAAEPGPRHHNEVSGVKVHRQGIGPRVFLVSKPWLWQKHSKKLCWKMQKDAKGSCHSYHDFIQGTVSFRKALVPNDTTKRHNKRYLRFGLDSAFAANACEQSPSSVGKRYPWYANLAKHLKRGTGVLRPFDFPWSQSK